MKREIFILLTFIIGAYRCSNPLTSGEDFFEAGEYKKAVAAYTVEIEQSGNDLDLIYNRGRSYEELGDLVSAEKDYNFILNNDPVNLNASLSMAKLAYEKEEYSRSLIISQEVVKNHETSANAHFLVARAKHQLGYGQSALEAYNNAISLNKEFGEAYLYRGALRSALKHKRACEDFKTAEILKVEGAKEAVNKYCN